MYIQRMSGNRNMSARTAQDYLLEAAQDLGYGIFEGLTGIITNPLSGLEKDGMKGFLKGKR